MQPEDEDGGSWSRVGCIDGLMCVRGCIVNCNCHEGTRHCGPPVLSDCWMGYFVQA